MSENWYNEIDQRMFMIPERDDDGDAQYGEYYDPEADHSAWAAVSATFPHAIPLNIIKDSFDYAIPRIIQEKLFAIGGGKHPTAIANTKQEPVDITFETSMQYSVFAAYALGSVASTGTQAEVVDITCLGKGSITQDSYFLINGIGVAGEEHWAVWMDVSGAGVKPVIAGINAANVLQLDFSDGPVADTPTATGDALVTLLDAADAYFGTPVNTAGVVRVTGASAGAVRDARDSGAVPSGITFSVVTQGANTHTVSEEVIGVLPSFTLHIEQQNRNDPGVAGAGEDIVIDLFGCVVDSYELSVDYESGIVKEALTIKCPHYSTGVVLTNPPPYAETVEPHTWANIIETDNNCLLQEGATSTVNGSNDKTPTSVNSIKLTIANNVSFKQDIGYRYGRYHLSAKRDVSLNIVGFSENRDTLDYHLDTWDNANQRYSTASGRLNSTLKLQRDATYDFINIHIYNWLLEEHNHSIVSIDDGIKGVDITLTGATPDSNRRLIDSFTIVDYLADTCYQKSFS
ncbi:MAG: hypothetical protein GY853_16745 [PVC group bacterium]|nr:hypothetical protein [PVC group bacterium]